MGCYCIVKGGSGAERTVTRWNDTGSLPPRRDLGKSQDAREGATFRESAASLLAGLLLARQSSLPFGCDRAGSQMLRADDNILVGGVGSAGDFGSFPSSLPKAALAN